MSKYTVWMSNSIVWPKDNILSSATAPRQSEPGSNYNEGVFHIPLTSNITGNSSSDRLVSYPGYSTGKSDLLIWRVNKFIPFSSRKQFFLFYSNVSMQRIEIIILCWNKPFKRLQSLLQNLALKELHAGSASRFQNHDPSELELYLGKVKESSLLKLSIDGT